MSDEELLGEYAEAVLTEVEIERDYYHAGGRYGHGNYKRDIKAAREAVAEHRQEILERMKDGS